MTTKGKTIIITRAALKHGMNARQIPLPLISRLELIILFSKKTFSNPSNQSKHEKKHGKKQHGRAVDEINDSPEHESPIL